MEITEEVARDLGARWIAAGGGWWPGMLVRGHRTGLGCRLTTSDPSRLWWESPTGDGWVYSVDGWESDNHAPPWPDLRDPATRGAALEVVRERRKDPLAWMDWLQTPSGLEWYVNLGGHGGGWFAGCTEAEALVAALEAAPRG
jgi:hypothetical protein